MVRLGGSWEKGTGWIIKLGGAPSQENKKHEESRGGEGVARWMPLVAAHRHVILQRLGVWTQARCPLLVATPGSEMALSPSFSVHLCTDMMSAVVNNFLKQEKNEKNNVVGDLIRGCAQQKTYRSNSWENDNNYKEQMK